MGVVFVPYLRKAAERVTAEETAVTGLSKRRLAAGALVAGVVAWLAARKLRASAQAAESAQAEAAASSETPPKRLRRVGKGWVRR